MRKDHTEYFRALGLNPGASPAEIKRAYRQLIQRWHPDHFKAGSLMQTTAEDMTKEINEAYEQLFKKQLYKRHLPKVAAQPATKSPFASPRPRSAAPTPPPRPQPKKPAPPVRRPPPSQARRWPWHWIVGAAGASVVVAVIWVSLPRPFPGFSAFDDLRSMRTPTTRSATRVGPQPGRSVAQNESHPVRAEAPVSRRTVGSPLAEDSLPAKRAAWMATELPPLPSAARPPANFEHLFHDASLLLRTFERGDSRARVVSVQGPPDEAGANILRYGSSVVYLSDGRVTGWVDRVPHLRVRTMPGYGDDLLATFSEGSSRDEVDRLQGRPDEVLLGAYLYGSSVVYFEGGRVTRWREGSEWLRLPLLRANSHPFFR